MTTNKNSKVRRHETQTSFENQRPRLDAPGETYAADPWSIRSDETRTVTTALLHDLAVLDIRHKLFLHLHVGCLHGALRRNLWDHSQISLWGTALMRPT